MRSHEWLLLKVLYFGLLLSFLVFVLTSCSSSFELPVRINMEAKTCDTLAETTAQYLSLFFDGNEAQVLTNDLCFSVLISSPSGDTIYSYNSPKFFGRKPVTDIFGLTWYRGHPEFSTPENPPLDSLNNIY